MKRIIAFVMLGLLIYASGFVIYYAAIDLKINNDTPVILDYLRPEDIRTGLVAEGSVYQIIDRVYSKKHQPKLLGIPFGEAKVQHFYALPLGTSDKFMLIAASEEEDIQALEKMKTDKPGKRGKDDPVLEVFGVMEETAPFDGYAFKEFLLYSYPELIGYDEYSTHLLESVAAKHIVPYTFYIKHPSGADYVPLIVGLAMFVTGAGLTALLIFRIKKERELY